MVLKELIATLTYKSADLYTIMGVNFTVWYADIDMVMKVLTSILVFLIALVRLVQELVKQFKQFNKNGDTGKKDSSKKSDGISRKD